MVNRKLISVRVDSDLLEIIDAECLGGHFVSRTDVINWALRMAVEYRRLNHRWLGRDLLQLRGDKVTRFDVEIEKGSWV